MYVTMTISGMPDSVCRKMSSLHVHMFVCRNLFQVQVLPKRF